MQNEWWNVKTNNDGSNQYIKNHSMGALWIQIEKIQNGTFMNHKFPRKIPGAGGAV